MIRNLIAVPLALGFAALLTACDQAGEQSGSAPQDPQTEQQSDASPDTTGTSDTQTQ